MKTLEEYMKLPYKLEIIPDTDEKGFAASYPELPGCVTCGSSIAEIVLNSEDAKRAWISAAIEEGIKINEPEDMDTSSTQLELRMSKTLHKTLCENSKKEGMSINQYCVDLLSKKSKETRLR